MGNYRNRISLDVLGSLDLFHCTRKRNREEKKNNLFEEGKHKIKRGKGRMRERERKKRACDAMVSPLSTQPLRLKPLPLPVCIGLRCS